jgi:hypothetical protein
MTNYANETEQEKTPEDKENTEQNSSTSEDPEKDKAEDYSVINQNKTIAFSQEQIDYIQKEADKMGISFTKYVRDKASNKAIIDVEKFHILDILERVEKIHNMMAATMTIVEFEAKKNSDPDSVEQTMRKAVEQVKINKRNNMES